MLDQNENILENYCAIENDITFMNEIKPKSDINLTGNTTSNNTFIEQILNDEYSDEDNIYESDSEENNGKNIKKKKLIIIFKFPDNEKNLFNDLELGTREQYEKENYNYFNENLNHSANIINKIQNCIQNNFNQKEISLNENKNQLENYNQIVNKKIRLQSDDTNHGMNKIIHVIQFDLISDIVKCKKKVKFKVQSDRMKTNGNEEKKEKIFKIEKFNILGQKRQKDFGYNKKN